MTKDRARKRKRRERKKKFMAAFKRIGTLNIVLILVGLFFLWFNWQMILLFKMYGNLPETYACAVVGATIGEAGICGWIRTNKDRHQDREWQKEDQAKEAIIDDGVVAPDGAGEEII